MSAVANAWTYGRIGRKRRERLIAGKGGRRDCHDRARPFGRPAPHYLFHQSNRIAHHWRGGCGLKIGSTETAFSTTA